MELPLILGSLAVVGSVAMLWWGVTARPSAARGHLLAGMDVSDDTTTSPLVAATRRLGDATRRRLPNALVDGLEVNLVQAGHPGGIDLPRILGIKVGLATLAALILVVGGYLLVALIAVPILFFLPDYWVLSVRDQRRTEIRAAAADVVDQLTICVEAGLGFEAALGRVATTSSGPLTDELRHTMSDIAAGVPRMQALRALADRTQIVEIRQLVTALLQAQKHGVSMAETLRIQSAEMRLKRTQSTEEKAAKLTVRMIFPIIVCYLPVFMIVTVVPSLISVLRAL